MNHTREACILQPAIRGKIADPLDYPVADARVVLSGTRLGEKLSTLTGDGGYFMFSPIPPGIYTLEIKYAGFSKLVQRGIAVQERAITGLDLKMNFQEDSRALKLSSFSLHYVDDEGAPPAGEELAPLARQLQWVVDGLSLERALFSPPSVLRVERAVVIELGLYQNLKEAIMRRLLERKIALFTGERIEVALRAELLAAGCRVLPKSLPRLTVDGPRYVEWRWEVRPQVPGLAGIRLGLDAAVTFAGRTELGKRLLLIEREVRVKRTPWQRLRSSLDEVLNRIGA
ncbi:MAG: carboxypeptidase regulatory-like domain-containing protein [Candidatus Aminicenantes bacterium]|nr:carboxypeptidase regulatory-like domain-containing protein [Candidatus Aminicenantes bacterium]